MTALSTEADRAAIRKAGKTTAILKSLAVGLLIILGFIYYDISQRYTAMQTGIRENAMWSVYQLDREARGLHSYLSMMLATGDIGIASQKRLSVHYDILYSRMDMLNKAKFERYFTVDEAVTRQLSEIQAVVLGSSPLFDNIADGVPASRDKLLSMHARFADLIRNTEQLVIYTNNTLSVYRAEQRNAVEALEIKSLVLIGLLVLIVGALILILRRQLDSVRRAGLGFERMAGDLESAYSAAEAGNRVKSQFMATMSHEIRTPLNAILGTVELMELSAENPESVRNLKTIHRSGEALLDIINEILDYSKIEYGKLELEMRSVDIRATVEGAVEMMQGRALDSGNKLVLDLPTELEFPFIRTDATRFRQVILNLVSNAVKFTANGTVTLAITEIRGVQSTLLRVEVQDTGIGIDEAGRAKLFLPFSQVDASIARKYGGTGLGLTICKEIVERLGGRIGVDSVYGLGSTFWFEIPIEEALPPPVSSAPVASPDQRPLPRLKILLVEDNVINMQVAGKFLAHLGQEVHTAENGAVAVEKADDSEFDLILMDMQMPVMDGIEATARIRQGGGRSRRTPIVAMTANASDDDTARCIDAGMDGFQSKPVSMEKLTRIIRSAAPSRHTGNEVTIEKTEPPSVNRGAESVDLSSFEDRRAELVAVLGEDDFAELLEAFFQDANFALTTLTGMTAFHETATIDRVLHTIKGAAGNVGLQPIAMMAQRMRERAFQPEDLEALRSAVEDCRIAIAA
ncbi:response regulator [Rhizobium daejeonense]|uniref:histidine kinase n=1 Tax=Rhizobium daejeonense TaxID=240521 RepID=A0A6M1S662_9HYPH|nr:ATP-binding protein [Rhizobium daejeonense]NGO65811.1 response regulator [Rhizobium daejeonense]